MSRIVTINVTPFYNSETCKCYEMRSLSCTISVPQEITKRELASKGYILRTFHFFSRFAGFSSHLLGKICFHVTIKENSNCRLYTTCFTFPKNI